MSLAIPFRDFVYKHKGKDVQICLKGGGPMQGQITFESLGVDGDPFSLYQIVCEAQISGGRPMRMPFFFECDAVLWYSPGPIAIDEPRIWGS